ncbi:sigma-54-dependent Fis family transcriptional regulator [Noviherbaspirillum cavernae]|uniref:Sigma-54-dependent Fis family transcriptional regulator n=1 Tax=Noviherbaspirillum cavernae TaxID=2320862 RepID=A0A418WXI8_9BURK|nr:sigma-54 dependent transcriptional regulator [Noviherbaspirillum cavernae]RJG04805.1 sigma-54-dependent Fis family transcriptional regulator [Noviherbaspirillum cavernae]
MLNVSNSAQTNQTVMVLRPSSRAVTSCQYSETLKSRGLNLIECPTLEAAWNAMHDGCRVGLLIVTREAELSQLDKCEPFVSNNQIAWVGLVAQELIATPRMREFIGEHLFNFITIPAELDHIILTLRHAWGMSFMREVQGKPQPDPQAAEADATMVGNSTQMRHLFSQIHKVARTDASVLVTGPSGTGKEIAALSIHRQSARRNAPFVAVNCGAIAPQLFQSELFGHEKGAFTGANQRKIGRIEAAQGGTLFLDEIGDMPFDMQVNLLRFLQQKTIERVGGTESIEIDVRIIAATHIDLAEAVRQGRFREDLYYRINVVCIEIPQLADRGQDIEDIARHYFSRFASLHNRSLRGFSKAAMHSLLAHQWPGNVRELVNRVQRATVMAEGRFIQPEDLGFDRQMAQTQVMSLEDARAAAESMVIRRALSQSRNQISRAAALLGVSRVTLYRLIDKYNIRADVMPPAPPELFNGEKPEREACK